jgi:hypothetical protein
MLADTRLFSSDQEEATVFLYMNIVVTSVVGGKPENEKKKINRLPAQPTVAPKLDLL